MKTSNLIRIAIALFALAQTIPSSGGETEFDAPVTADDAKTSWRYIALDSGGMTCPDADRWQESKLFGNSESAPPGLDKFCVYQTSNPAATAGDLAQVLCSAGEPPPNCLTEFKEDLLVLTYLGTQAVEGLIVNDFSTQFLSQAGAVGPLPASPAVVRLTVVDTEPSGAQQDRDGPGIADHGFTLLNLVRASACPDNGSCAMQPGSSLGLPLQLCSTDPGASCQCSGVPVTGVCEDPAVGGYVGTPSTLAAGIFEAVANWQATGPQRLVINLSVGWEPFYGGQPPLAGVSLPIQSVARALEYASCRGAIIVAAAGNRVPGPQSFTGPLYPAGWETEAAPGEGACNALYGGADPTMFPVPANTYRPLVYSAAAIDHAGAPVETRQDSEPRLVAFGDHAVVNTTLPGPPAVVEPTATLTGSSVAAAVVSSAAAAAWFQRPLQPGYRIMEELYAAATTLPGRNVDYCLGGICGALDVRRVNICETVAAVCSALPGSSCASFSCPIDVPVIAPVPTTALLAAFALDHVTDLSTFNNSAQVVACSPNYTLHWNGPSQPDVPCPHLQYYGLQVTPWTDGQPSGQACEACIDNFASPGKLFLEVKDEFAETLEYLTLLCGNDAYRLPGTLQPGDRRLISEIPVACETKDLGIAFRTTRNGVHKASVLSASLKTGDRDDDGIQDALDNCYEVANPSQLDTDGDMIGNACDGDFNNDCISNVIDLGSLKSVFFTAAQNQDMNGDGIVNAIDLGMFKDNFFAVPGPSGIPNLCSL